MKILFLARPDLFQIKAGDTVQIEELFRSLQKIGISVDLSTEIKPDLAGYDLVHCFNMLRIETCLVQCKWVKNKKIPLILTPVYWDLEEYLANNYPERLKWWEMQQKKRCELLQMVDLLAPNAESEYRQIEKNFSIQLPWNIIHNGVEKDYILSRNITEKRDIVLAVGRIHPRKNQLNMIKALKDTGIPLVFIGKVNDKQYYRRCQQEADENIKFIDEVDRSWLKEYYLRAKTHLMVSWYDTPGLVNLEAGLADCDLVVSSRGTAYDYFGDKAAYCGPTEIDKIRATVLKSYYKENDRGLRSHILNNYTWNKIALKTRNIYSTFLS